jgi:hypothetical protein
MNLPAAVCGDRDLVISAHGYPHAAAGQRALLFFAYVPCPSVRAISVSSWTSALTDRAAQRRRMLSLEDPVSK